MFICVYMCIYIYIYVFICVCIYIYIYICVCCSLRGAGRMLNHNTVSPTSFLIKGPLPRGLHALVKGHLEVRISNGSGIRGKMKSEVFAKYNFELTAAAAADLEGSARRERPTLRESREVSI